MEEEKRTGSIAASGHVNVDQGLSGQDDADMLGKYSSEKGRKEVRNRADSMQQSLDISKN